MTKGTTMDNKSKNGGVWFCDINTRWGRRALLWVFCHPSYGDERGMWTWGLTDVGVCPIDGGGKVDLGLVFPIGTYPDPWKAKVAAQVAGYGEGMSQPSNLYKAHTTED